MTESEPTWVARLTPAAGHSVEELLGLPLGLDVWERRADALVVAAPESRLAELERRRLASVERWGPPTEHRARAPDRPEESGEAPSSDGKG